MISSSNIGQTPLWGYSRLNLVKLIYLLQIADWNPVLTDSSSDAACKVFYKIVNNYMAQYDPVKITYLRNWTVVFYSRVKIPSEKNENIKERFILKMVTNVVFQTMVLSANFLAI